MNFVYYILGISALLLLASGLWVMLIPFLILFFIIKEIIYYIVKKKIRCEHGIRTGGDIEKCMQCVNQANEIMRRRDILNLSIKYKSEQITLMKKKHYHSLDYFYSVDPYEFEDVIMEMYRRLGYTVYGTTYSNDRGKDGIAYKSNSKYLIECKRYAKENRVGRPHLQKFFAAMHEEDANKGFFVTTGYFAKTAYEYAESNNIVLISGTKLIALMQEAYPEKYSDTVSLLCDVCGEVNRYNSTISSKHIPCICGNQIKTIEYGEMFKKPRSKSNRY